MKLKKYILLLFVILGILFSGLESLAQKNLDRGKAYYGIARYYEAIPYFIKEKESTNDVTYREATELLAMCYRNTGQFLLANDQYAELKKKYAKNDASVIKKYGESLKESAKYQEAIEEFQQYKKRNTEDKDIDMLIESCEMAEMMLIKNATDPTYYVRNVKPFNTSTMDFAPTYLDSGIVIASERPECVKKFISSSGNSAVYLDLFYGQLSKYEEGVSNKRFSGLNTYLHEGPASFSKDGKEVYFTRTVKPEKGEQDVNLAKATLQILYSELLDDGTWTEAKSVFDFNSSEYSVFHPCLSSDEQSLYFASNMPGGKGGIDIWVTKKNDAGQWAVPTNLGEFVNTRRSEMYPSVYMDTVLYFSSNGHLGVGKLDIFSATYTGRVWEDVVNMELPINSIGDDISFVRKNGENHGFFSSDRPNGLGGDDIYTFYEIKRVAVTLDGDIIRMKDDDVYSGYSTTLEDAETKEKTQPIKMNGYNSFDVPDKYPQLLRVRQEGRTLNSLDIRKVRDTSEFHLYAEMKPRQDISFDGYLKEFDKNLKYEGDTTSSKAYAEFPVSKATVQLIRKNKLVKEVKTDALGYYNFGKLKKRKPYTIIAVKDGKTVKVNFIGHAIFDEKPLDSVKVTMLHNGKFSGEATSNNNGEFSFKLIPGRNYQLIANRNGYNEKQVKISTLNVAFTQTIEQNILMNISDSIIFRDYLSDTSMVGPVKLIGKITSGKHILNTAAVKVYDSKKRILESKQTNNDGIYAFNIDKGKYSIVVTKKHFKKDSIVIDTKTSDNGVFIQNFDLICTNPDILKKDNYVLCKGPVVSGGNPLAGAKVQLMNLDSTVVDSAFTDEKGIYTFEQLKRDTAFILKFTHENEYLVSDAIKVSTKDIDDGLILYQGAELDSLPMDVILAMERKKKFDAAINYFNKNKTEAVGMLLSSYDTLPTEAFLKIEFAGFVIDSINTDSTGQYKVNLPKDTVFNVIVSKIEHETYDKPMYSYANLVDTLPDGNIKFDDIILKSFIEPEIIVDEEEYGNLKFKVTATGVVTYNNEVLKSADVILYDGGVLFTQSKTNENGEYIIEDIMSDHEYQLEIITPDSTFSVEYNTKEMYPEIYNIKDINLSPTPEDEVVDGYIPDSDVSSDDFSTTTGEIELGGTISSGGNALSGAWVKLSKGTKVLDSFPTRETGHYKFGLDRNQSYKISVYKYGYLSQTLDIKTLDNAEDINKDVILTAKNNVVIKGKVTHRGEPVEGAYVSLNTATQHIEKYRTKRNGTYKLNAKADENFTIETNSSGYRPNSLILRTADMGDGETKTINISIDKDSDAILPIDNIYYDYNSYKLKKESFIALNGLVEYLKINSNIGIEVRSHSDSRGTPQYNLELSIKRSEAVINYLKYKGISADRITYRGFGETEPIIPGAVTEEEHKLNRRSEFRKTTDDYLTNPVQQNAYDLNVVSREDVSRNSSDANRTDYEKIEPPKDDVVFMLQVDKETKTKKKFGAYSTLEKTVSDVSVKYVYYKSKYYYVVCCFDKIEDAIMTQNQIIDRGYTAWVVAFVEGKSVSVKDAIKYYRKKNR